MKYAAWACSAVVAIPVNAIAEPRFSDQSDAFPIEHIYSGGWTHFVGGGVAVFDCNADNRPDIFAAGGESPASLFVNTTMGHAPMFEVGQLPDPMNAVTGAYPLDINNDGHGDLVVLRNGQNLLLEGDGTCNFRVSNADWGFDGGTRWSTAFSATWESGQDWPTLAVGNYVDQADPEGPFESCDFNTLHRPEGSGYSTSVPLEPGYCALSMLFSDWQRKGQAELRISNDRHYYVRGGYEQMWRMDPLQERGPEDGWDKVTVWGMGIASADLQQDGFPDVMLTSMGDQVMLLNDEGRLSAAPYSIGTTAHRPHVGDDGRPSTGWHAEFQDMDNDGRLDLFIAKGNVDQMPGLATKDPNNLLMQTAEGDFKEAAGTAGIATFDRSRGAGIADFNSDGRLDLVVVNRRAPLELWINETAAGYWAQVTPQQEGPNRDAIGSWLEISGPHGTEWRERTIGGGHVSGSLLPWHIGFGTAKNVRVRLHWPDGATGDWVTLDAGERLRIKR